MNQFRTVNDGKRFLLLPDGPLHDRNSEIRDSSLESSMSASAIYQQLTRRED
jgi:hypothetical protein